MGVWVYGCMGVWVYGCMGVWGEGKLQVQSTRYGCSKRGKKILRDPRRDLRDTTRRVISGQPVGRWILPLAADGTVLCYYATVSVVVPPCSTVLTVFDRTVRTSS